jgi:hypothetical protein
MHKVLAVVVVMGVLRQVRLLLWVAVAAVVVMAQLPMRRIVGRFIRVRLLHQAVMVALSVFLRNLLAAVAV